MADVSRVRGGEARHLRFETRKVRRRLEGAAALEDEAVLRVEPAERDMILEPLAAGREDVGEDPRIEEERRAEVEAVAQRRPHDPRAAADRGFLLEHCDRHTLLGEQERGGKPAGTGSDDRDAGGGRRWHPGQGSLSLAAADAAGTRLEHDPPAAKGAPPRERGIRRAMTCSRL